MIFNHKNASLLSTFTLSKNQKMHWTLRFIFITKIRQIALTNFLAFWSKTCLETPDGVVEVPDWMKKRTKIHF